MSVYNDDNPYGLSPNERRVLHHWQNGETMADAYRKVMLPQIDKELSEAAFNKRVQRFFGTLRMKEAMAASAGKRGTLARRRYKKWKKKQDRFLVSGDDEKKIKKRVLEDKAYEKRKKELEEAYREHPEELTVETIKSARDKWLESLNVNDSPNAITIYGTGQFLAYIAVKEIMARQAEIKAEGVSVLDKNGSVLTPTIISALKTAAAMILPFAPAPTAEDRKEMTKAAALLGLFPDDIIESPDDYKAPPPPAVDTSLASDKE